MAKKAEKVLATRKQQPEWYKELLADLKRLSFEGIVKTKHAIGLRINSEKTVKDPQYGSQYMKMLAKDLRVSKTDLYACMQFASEYPHFSHAVGKFGNDASWRFIRNYGLPKPRLTGRAESETPPLPPGKYEVVYADPPWQYDNSGLGGAAATKYPTMDIESIKNLQDSQGQIIQDCFADNCVLFLWTTNAFLEDAIAVLVAWGFAYKTNMCWVKEGRATYGKLGFYVYGKHELLLIATRGSMLPKGKLPLSVQSFKKKRHSQKPDEFHSLIEKMYPIEGLYLELFARKKYSEKWQIWGNEISWNTQQQE